MNINKKFLFLLLFFCLILFSSFFKISPVLGSYTLSFSGINFFMPVLGYFLRPLYIPLIFVFFFLKKITLGGAITLGIPSFFAAITISIINKKNFSKKYKYGVYDFLLRVILPLAAVILFVSHPVGRQAYSYSFYWFIPVYLFFIEKLGFKKFIFSSSLSATFIAHSIGSLIWLYTINMTASQWMALIPVVAIERLVFAAGISLTYMLLFKKTEIKSIVLQNI